MHILMTCGRLLSLLTAPLVALLNLQATAQPYPDPLVEQRADPWVWKHHDGYYYFIATVPEYDRIELRRARTLAGLQQVSPHVIWRKHDRGPMSWHIWAPELHFIDGRWIIYFAAGKAEAIWDIRMYALENTSPNPLEGEWVERGQIRTPWESFSLDATSFEHRGRRVTVRGTVESYYQKQLAQETLRRIDGIDEIENHLSVCWPTEEAIGIAQPV